MSGGRFNHAYVQIRVMADDLADAIANNGIPDGCGLVDNHRPDTLVSLKKCEAYLRTAAALAREVEWLYSGDLGDDTFAEAVAPILNAKPRKTKPKKTKRVTK